MECTRQEGKKSIKAKGLGILINMIYKMDSKCPIEMSVNTSLRWHFNIKRNFVVRVFMLGENLIIDTSHLKI